MSRPMLEQYDTSHPKSEKNWYERHLIPMRSMHGLEFAHYLQLNQEATALVEYSPHPC